MLSLILQLIGTGFLRKTTLDPLDLADLVAVAIKDRQQEAEHSLRYLTLFARYFMYINIQCMK